MKESNKLYLINRMQLKGRLLTSMKSVKSKLSSYPSLKLVSEGSVLKYFINSDDTPDRLYSLELQKDMVTLTLNSSASPLYFLQEELLRVITFTMLLSEDYKLELDCLLPYVVNFLIKGKVPYDTPSAISINRDSDIILATRIVELLRLNKEINQNLRQLNDALMHVLSGVIINRYSYNFREEKIVKELGISPELAKLAINYLKENGYKPISNTDGTISLVRI